MVCLPRHSKRLNLMKHTLIALVLLLASPLLGAKPLDIFVSVLPQQTFVEKIGGEHVRVHTMVTPGNSPATYSPTPQQISALSKADLYIRIGVPFENAWMDRIQSANPTMPILDLRQNIDMRSLEQHSHHDDHGHDNSHDGELDPHLWTSPPVVKQLALTIQNALINKTPEHAATYKKNYQAFSSELNALDTELQQSFKGSEGLKFLVFHPSWGYFAETYGLQQIAIEKEGKQPGAKALTTIIDQANNEGISIIFVQPQFDKKLAAQIAKAINGKVIAIDPLSADYIANMREVAKQMAGVLSR